MGGSPIEINQIAAIQLIILRTISEYMFAFYDISQFKAFVRVLADNFTLLGFPFTD